MTFAERLNELLNERYMSAARLAAEIGLSAPAVRNWRRNNSAVQLKNLLQLSEFFNCSLDFICGRTEDEGIFKKDILPSFGERLKQLIDSSKQSIECIARETDLNRHNFYDWMNGSQPVSSSLVVLADYFDCTIDYLVGLED